MEIILISITVIYIMLIMIQHLKDFGTLTVKQYTKCLMIVII